MAAVPPFARPLDQNKEEKRRFSINLGDNTVLDFELNSLPKVKLCGKLRMMAGKVSINNESCPAMMIIGENGFDIMYMYRDRQYFIRPKFSLDIGYVNYLSKFSDAELAKTIEHIKNDPGVNMSDRKVEEMVLTTSGRRAKQDNDQEYTSVSEAGSNYNLVNMTQTTQNRIAKEGPSTCTETVVPHQGNSKNNTLASADDGIYFVLVAYKDQALLIMKRLWN